MTEAPGLRSEEATLAALCRYFARLGLLGFGGPVALVGFMQRDLVEDRRWISDQEYRDGLAVAQMAPGPLAAQLAMWLAFVRQGILGATLASLSFIVPPFLVVLGLAYSYRALGGAPWMQAAFYGIGPAAIAIIAIAAYRLLGITAERDPLLWGVLSIVAAVTFVTKTEVAIVFLASGLFVAVIRLGRVESLGALRRLLSRTRISGPGSSLLLPASLAQRPEFGILGDLAAFFVKAGAFVFGSGLAIVPFMRQGLLVDHQWLTEQEFLDSVAVGLISPGPVVITATFVGFLIAGLPGALIGTLGIFLPVYLFVVIPGPWLIRYKDVPAVRGFVAGVSAAAAGAIVGASVILGQQAISDLVTAAIALGSLAALVLLRKVRLPIVSRLPEPFVVLGSSLLGLVLAPT